VDIPNLAGGFVFVGFTDAGASISSVSINVVGAEGDIISVDDVRYSGSSSSTVPEPASVALTGGVLLFGLLSGMRRKRA
jgi:hypothetical protein